MGLACETRALHGRRVVSRSQTLSQGGETLDTLQLSRSNVNSVVRSYLSPTPVGVGVGTSLIWAVDQTLSSLRESGYARLEEERGGGGGVVVQLEVIMHS